MDMSSKSPAETTVRLDKYLANLGVCSRRNIKALLKEHILTVNGDRIRESGFRLDPQRDQLLLDGKKLAKPKLQYFLLNKPKGIISTTDDEFSRDNVISLVKSDERIYPVGRLDKDTSGLILLTNDGELTNLLTHPRYHVSKTYRLTVNGTVNDDQLQSFRTGVNLTDGTTAPAIVVVREKTPQATVLEVTLFEGRNRQIRRMCEELGIDLRELQRIKFGPLPMGNLQEGAYRELSQDEVELLRTSAKSTTA